MKKILLKTIVMGILCVSFLACGNEDSSDFKPNKQIEQNEDSSLSEKHEDSLNIPQKDAINSESNMKEESPLVE